MSCQGTWLQFSLSLMGRTWLLLKTEQKRNIGFTDQIINISYNTISRTVLAPEKSQKHISGLWLEEIKHSCIACTHTEIGEEEKYQLRCELLPTALWLPAEQVHATGRHEGKERSQERLPAGGTAWSGTGHRLHQLVGVRVERSSGTVC